MQLQPAHRGPRSNPVMSDPQHQVVIPQVAPPAPASSISDKEIEMLGAVISSFAQPLAHALETVAVETTKQTKIIAEDLPRVLHYRGRHSALGRLRNVAGQIPNHGEVDHSSIVVSRRPRDRQVTPQIDLRAVATASS